MSQTEGQTFCFGIFCLRASLCDDLKNLSLNRGNMLGTITFLQLSRLFTSNKTSIFYIFFNYYFISKCVFPATNPDNLFSKERVCL